MNITQPAACPIRKCLTLKAKSHFNTRRHATARDVTTPLCWPARMRRNRILKFSAGRLLKYSGFRILHETYVLKLYTRARDVITLQSLCWPLFAIILGHLVFNISQSENTVILLLLRLGDPNRIPFDPCLKSFFCYCSCFSPLCVDA